MTEPIGIPDKLPATSADVVQRARAALDERDHPTRGGHGHVRPRVDGFRARCGGPRYCTACQREVERTPEPWSLVRELLAEVETAQKWAAWFAAAYNWRRECDNALNWGTTCLNCASMLDRSYDDYMRAEEAEQKAKAASREVEKLRAAVERVRERICEHAKCPGGPLCCCDNVDLIQAERDELRATVERVRRLAAEWDRLGTYDLPSAPYAPGFATALRKALDGEADRDDD